MSAALQLDRLQQSILAPQVEAFLAAAPDDAARAPYLELRAALEAGEVPPQLTDRLGAIAEIALTSGRVRAVHGPGAELALWRLFQQTPRGREFGASVAALNQALAPLAGQVLQQASAIARGPGAYALTLKTEACAVVIRFEPAGVRVESLEVG